MTRQRLRVRIGPNGLIQAETIGFVGEACLDVIPVVESLVASRVVASTYLPEFWATAAAADTSTAAVDDAVDREPPRYVTEMEAE